jgi:hypothetical protein
VALNPRTYSYPKLFVHAIALTVAWWAVKSLTWRRIAALSAATALGYYFRHDHALYIGVATVALLVVAQWRTGLATVARSVALFGALAFAFVVPHLAYVQWAAGLPYYLQVIRVMYMKPRPATASPSLPTGGFTRFVIATSAILIVVLGLFPDTVAGLAQRAAAGRPTVAPATAAAVPDGSGR